MKHYVGCSMCKKHHIPRDRMGEKCCYVFCLTPILSDEFFSFSPVHTIKHSIFKEKTPYKWLTIARNATTWILHSLEMSITFPLYKLYVLLWESMAAQTLPKVTILTENVRAEINSILRGHVAIIMKPSLHYILTESTIFGPWSSNGTRPSAKFSSQLWNKIWEWVGNEAKKFLLAEVCWHRVHIYVITYCLWHNSCRPTCWS